MKLVKHQVALVTGCTSGIGLALAQDLAQRGLRLVLADIEGASLTTVAKDLADQGCDVLAVPADVRSPAQVADLQSAAQERFGTIDLLCSNAGVAPPRTNLWNVTDGDVQWVFDVNVRGTVNMFRAFLPSMMGRGMGHVLVTASFIGLCPAPFLGVYSSSKHAVVGLCGALREELRIAESQIGVTIACPGGVTTGLREAIRNRRYRPPEYGDYTEPAADLPPRRDRSGQLVDLPSIGADEAAHQMLLAVELNQEIVVTDAKAVGVVRQNLDEVERDLRQSPISASGATS